MSDGFDPYYTWLGIPPQEQPPDHYRLLGIRRFENNAEAISNAADQRMAHIRSFQTGGRAEQSQAILNELSKASGCLLNRDAKSAYDRELRQKDAPRLSRSAGAAQGKRSSSNPSPTNDTAPVAADLVPLAAEPLPASPTPQPAYAYNVAPTYAPANAGRFSASRLAWHHPLLLVAFAGVALGFLGIIALTAAYVGAQMLAKSLPPSNAGRAQVRPAFNHVQPRQPPTRSMPPSSPRERASPIDLAASAGTPIDLRNSFVVRGRAAKEGNAWVTHGGPGYDAIMFPGTLPEEYVVETVVTRLNDNEGLVQGLVVGNRQCMVTVDGFKPSGIRTVLDLIDGRRAGAPQDPCEYRGTLLTKGKPSVLKYYVLKDRLIVECDGKTILNWTGGMSRLSLFPLFQVPDHRALFWGSWDGSFRLSKFEVRPITSGGPQRK